MLFLKYILFGLNQHVFVHKRETGLVQSLSIRTETPYKHPLYQCKIALRFCKNDVLYLLCNSA